MKIPRAYLLSSSLYCYLPLSICHYQISVIVAHIPLGSTRHLSCCVKPIGIWS